MSRLAVREHIEDRPHRHLRWGSQQASARWLPNRWLPIRLLTLPSNVCSFDVRGFRDCHFQTRQTLERHGRAFVTGFNASLAAPTAEALVERLSDLLPQERGFGHEGAAMALGILDTVHLIDPQRLPAFIRGSGQYRYLTHVGCGWAMARLNRRRPRLWRALDPLLRWLAFDGWGFHEGFFKPGRAIDRQRRPRRLQGYELRTFDQGLGRSLWFVAGANCRAIMHAIGRFQSDRHADLWSGVGLAATYAGGVPTAELQALASAAGRHGAHVAQGAAFAAKARVHGANVVPATEVAVGVFCDGASVSEAAAVTDHALEGLCHDGSAEDYEQWRTAIRHALASRG
jgi:hypothetical protein